MPAGPRKVDIRIGRRGEGALPGSFVRAVVMWGADRLGVERRDFVVTIERDKRPFGSAWTRGRGDVTLLLPNGWLQSDLREWGVLVVRLLLHELGHHLKRVPHPLIADLLRERDTALASVNRVFGGAEVITVRLRGYLRVVSSSLFARDAESLAREMSERAVLANLLPRHAFATIDFFEKGRKNRFRRKRQEVLRQFRAGRLTEVPRDAEEAAEVLYSLTVAEGKKTRPSRRDRRDADLPEVTALVKDLIARKAHGSEGGAGS
jgi:hypothetical protein